MTPEKFRIILGKCSQEKRQAVKEKFKELFAVGEMLAKQVVQAAPIVVLTGLGRDQAMEIFQVLRPLRDVGGDIRIEISDDRSISQVAWPKMPKVAGKDLEFFEKCAGAGDPHVFFCPECGARLAVHAGKADVPESDATPAPEPYPEPEPEPPSSFEDDLLQMGSASTGLTPPPQAPIHDDDPLFSNLQPLPQTPMPGMVGSVDDLDNGIDQAARAVAKKVKKGETATDENDPAPTVQEKVPVSQPAPARASARKSRKLVAGNFNVIVSKTGNPQVIPLLMEDLKLTEEKARLVMKKPLIAVARGLGRESAIKVASRYKKIGLNPRIGRKK